MQATAYSVRCAPTSIDAESCLSNALLPAVANEFNPDQRDNPVWRCNPNVFHRFRGEPVKLTHIYQPRPLESASCKVRGSLVRGDAYGPFPATRYPAAWASASVV